MHIRINGKRYKFKPNKNTFTMVFVIILLIIIVVSLGSCNKYNKKIQGAEYEDIYVNLPVYQVRPCVTPDGVPTCSYFEIYPPEKGDKVMYLTFDDGPSSKSTPQILDVLKKYDVKATFFVLGTNAEKNPELLKRIAKEGHAIANHSYSHVMSEIYADTDSFINEINKAKDVIVNIVGEKNYAGVIRFPGGAFREEHADMKEVLLENDIPYVNWNCLTGDAETHNPVASDLYNKAIRTASDVGKDSLVLLMHDTNAKPATVDALPAIIEHFRDEGFRFDVIKRK